MKASDTTTRAVILDVPYLEKDEAKELGARWDPDIRKWFVPRGVDPQPFAKWLRGKQAETESDSLRLNS